jgi:hypothetical protein
MPARIADYSIIRENALTVVGLDEIAWKMPANLDRGSRSILGFILRLADIDNWVQVRVLINGHITYKRRFESDYYGTIIQVVKKNFLLHGQNIINFEVTGGDDLRVVVKVADVVLWWQANI